jgi:hypothetical protein
LRERRGLNRHRVVRWHGNKTKDSERLPRM